MSTATTKLLTAEEFAQLPEPADGSKQELVKGVVITMPPPGFVHGKVQGRVYFALETFVRSHPIGQITVESGIITETGPATVRGPDVAFWSHARLPPEEIPVVYANVAADLIAEIRSPSNTKGQLTAKIREYFAAGCRMVWIVDPDERTVTVFREPSIGTTYLDDQTLSGEDILPGFSCPVADFFG